MDPYVTSTPNSTKLPILNTGKFEQWKFRIQQYLQHEHYALWEVIEFSNSYRALAQDKSVSDEATPSSRSKGRIVAVTAEDMQKRRNDVKARTTLLLALPDEHQLRFSKYETAKELWEAILRTFGGNEATKKTKKNLLKQQYGNFKAEGSETLEQTFNRLQAIVSQLEFLDVPVEQEDLNQKFLTSLSPEWLMHTIVWRNRNDLDTMSLDDLYNHLKVYESEVQKKGGSSSQNMAFISSSNTNSGKSEVPTAQSFSTASGQVTTASTEVATATFSHDTICAYIATQQSGSQIKYEDITQIDDDDIEEMDIKWNMALLSMRADRFWKKTGKKITIQGSDVAGFDKSKVECFNCHKLGHFARECRAPRSQDRSRRESYKKEPKVEEPSHKAMMAIDGIGWDWSFMAEENEASENQALVAEEVVPTEFALMAMSSSSSDNEVYDDSYCSKSCRKNTENLTTKISKLREELFDSESDLCNYKRGLSQVEARLVEFKINESKFCKRIRVLERDLELKDYKIENLTNELEKIKKERDGIDSKLEKFVNSSKDLDQMLESQKSSKDKKGVGFDEYRTVPPPPAQVYSSSMPDLSWTGLPEFTDNTVTDYTRPTPSVDVTNDVRSELDGNNLTVYEHGRSSSNTVSKPIINFVKESGCPNVIKINNIENARKLTAKYAELYRNITQSSNVRSNNFGPPIIKDWDSEDESDTESTPVESIRSFSTARTSLNVAQPKMKSFVKSAHSNVKRPFERKAVAKNKIWVPTVRTKNPTVGLKVPTAKPTVATAKGNKGKAVKALARWIWIPKQISGEGSNVNGVSVTFKKYQYIDTQGRLNGCSRHMINNISYLSDYEPYDEEHVSFGYGGGKITGKSTIKTGKLEFENVHFVKELKYNLFSVSQICDNKNCVLFIDSECIVLGRDFKLEDDRHVLLRTPRQQNMYAVDLKDIVPYKNLTCLIAKVFVNESMLWHRRLGHLNFKLMNKLVRNNLVIGLPSKIFENDHSCVDCLKGKQHKASCKSKLVNSSSKPLHTLHMDLFGPTFISSLNHKWYRLVITNDFSRFTWTFFLKTKDETYRILRNFITEIENLKDLKVKIIRCDNGGKFRNKEMDDFCSRKEAARTMLADVKLPVTFWTEAVNTACYVQNRVLVSKPFNKTPYELFNGRAPSIGFLRPFGCHVMILNTLDHLGKFDAKGDEGFFVGYSLNSKAFRVYNKRTKHIEENLHINFLESKVIDKAGGPNWLFDIESLIKSMNYIPVVGAGTSSSNISGTKEDVKQAEKEKGSPLRFIALPNWFHEAQMITTNDAAKKSGGILIDSPQKEQEEVHTDKDVSEQVEHEVNEEVPESSGISFPTASSKESSKLTSTPTVETVVPTVSTHVPTASENIFTIDPSEPPSTPTVETTVPTVSTPVPTVIKSRGGLRYSQPPSISNVVSSENRVEDFFRDSTHATRLNEVEADLSNMETTIQVSPTPTLRIHKDHPKNQIIGPVDTLVLTRHKSKNVDEQSFLATIHQKIDLDLLQLYERGIVIRNKAKLAAQGHTQEEGIYYEEVFAPVARIKAIRSSKCYQKKDGIFLSQDKYVGDILKKFGFSDLRSMIGSLMYLTASRRDIMFDQTIVATSTTEAEYVAAASGCGQVLWIQNQLLDYGYNFMNTKIYIDNNSAICIVKNPVFHSRTKHIEIRHHFIRDCFEKKLIYVDHIHTDDNVADLLTKAFDVGRFQYLVIVDFLQASHISKGHIRQFWSTARIKTADGETNILAKINGKQRTISESSIRRHLKLNDEEGISTLPDNELFENLSLMGYNILPNQRFSFQKGQFSCQWKFLIHTIMQCLSPKSTSFNEFSSNIATALVCLATNRTYNFSKMIFDGMMRNVNSKGKFLMYPSDTRSPTFPGRNVDLFKSMLVPQGEGLVNPTEPHHTPSPQALFPQSQEPIPHKTTTLTSSQEPTSQQISTPSHTPTPRRLTKRAIRIAQSKALTPGADEPASPPRDDSHGEAFPTATSLDAGQDRENIPKTSAMPHESSPRVTSLGGDEGSLQLKLNELMDFCTKLQSQHSQMAAKIQSQDLEISQLKTRIKTLEDAQTTRGDVQEDAPNRGE
ncbi:putative ribonuclease H-like domain-containing protein [Tanacetum coccineum]